MKKLLVISILLAGCSTAGSNFPTTTCAMGTVDEYHRTTPEEKISFTCK